MLPERGNTYHNTYEVDIKVNLIDVCNNIRGGELQNIYRTVIRRAQICTEIDGKHIDTA